LECLQRRNSSGPCYKAPTSDTMPLVSSVQHPALRCLADLIPVRIALFFTGPKHAGENIAEVLKQRARELPAPSEYARALVARLTCQTQNPHARGNARISVETSGSRATHSTTPFSV